MKLSRRNFLTTVSVAPAVVSLKSPIRPDLTMLKETILERPQEIIDGDFLVCNSVQVEPQSGMIQFYNKGDLIYTIHPGYDYKYNEGDVITLNGVEIRLPFKLS